MAYYCLKELLTAQGFNIAKLDLNGFDYTCLNKLAGHLLVLFYSSLLRQGLILYLVHKFLSILSSKPKSRIRL